MVEMLLSVPGGYGNSVNEGDIVTGFTPSHIAVFVNDQEILYTLASYGARLEIEDNFGATAIDYLRLLDYLPRDNQVSHISCYNRATSSMETWEVSKLESTFNIEWSPYYRISYEYIEELMFSGFQLGDRDEAFRKSYLDIIMSKSGDDNLLICEIDEKIGWGAFAIRDIKKGEYVITYGGKFVSEGMIVINSGFLIFINIFLDHQSDRSYSMQCGIEGIILDSSKYRNLASFINHSTKPNVESTCIFHKGIELAVIIAIKDIKRGEQLLLNYGKEYFEKIGINSFVDLAEGDPNSFPLLINISD